MRQDGSLQREIGVLVGGVAARAGEGALESALVAKLIGRLRGRAADDRRIQLERVNELEVDRLARAFLFGHCGSTGELTRSLGRARRGSSTPRDDRRPRARRSRGSSPAPARWAGSEARRRRAPRQARRCLAHIHALSSSRGIENDVAVADAADLDDLHVVSIHGDIPRLWRHADSWIRQVERTPLVQCGSMSRLVPFVPGRSASAVHGGVPRLL